MTTTKGRRQRRRRRRRSGKTTTLVGAAAVLVALGVVSRLEVAVAEYQCPSFDPARLEELATKCLEDPDGLCGDVCVKAITSSAANPEVANMKIPCTGGVDGVLENVLKKCTEELGAPFDPCGGKTKKSIVDASSMIKCEEGGVLADY